MSKEDLIVAIESRLDTIEELLDRLEDQEVDVEVFRDYLGKVWNEWGKFFLAHFNITNYFSILI